MPGWRWSPRARPRCRRLRDLRAGRASRRAYLRPRGGSGAGATIAPSMTTPAPRFGLIHATPLAVQPVQDAFAHHWPQARRMNLLDDSLSVDRAAAGQLTEAL